MEPQQQSAVYFQNVKGKGPIALAVFVIIITPQRSVRETSKHEHIMATRTVAGAVLDAI